VWFLKNISENIHFIEIRIIFKKKVDKITNNFFLKVIRSILFVIEFFKECCIFDHFIKKGIFHTFFVNIFGSGYFYVQNTSYENWKLLNSLWNYFFICPYTINSFRAMILRMSLYFWTKLFLKFYVNISDSGA